MVLPLPLVPFESYMLADDRPAYPMNCFLRFRFVGRFDRAALDAAMSVAVSRHPLLSAVVRRSGRRWVWQPADRLPVIQWLDSPPAESLPRLDPLDIRVTPGMRVAMCEGQGRTDMTLQVHHSCCDGLGAMTFAEDLLVAYAIARGAAPAGGLQPRDPAPLRGRGRFDLTLTRFLKILPEQLAGLAGARRFLMRTPEPLVPHRAQVDDAPLPPRYPASLTRRLDESQTAAVRAAAGALDVTVNDLLARQVFLSLAQWRRRHAPGRDDAWLRLCVPMSLRTAAQDRLPAANVVSMVFLDRRPDDAKDPGRLLISIHDQMERIKRLRLGLTFVLSLGICRHLPGGLARMCRNRRCRSTAVFTNMGRLFAQYPLIDEQGRVTAGEVVLEDIDLLPPLRPLTCAAINVWSYAGRLCFTLHYDPRVLTAGQAGELADGLIAGIGKVSIAKKRLATVE